MALYVPNPDGMSAADLIEYLGAQLAARFAAAEQVMIEQAAKHAYKILDLERAAADMTDLVAQQRALQALAVTRAQALHEMRELAGAVTREITDQQLAAWLVDIAAADGLAAAAARLQLARRLPVAAGFTGSASQAVGALLLDLHSKLSFLNARLTRFPDDIYKQLMSEHSYRVLLGVETPLIMQRKAVQDFLSKGITGFVDKANRQWRIGTYAEMVGRTSAQRAWQEAGIWRMQQSGINLVTVVRGADSCEKCARWGGKILSTSGPALPQLLPHSTQDRNVAVTPDGTVEQARLNGWGHPNCFPGWVPVSAPTGVSAADSRWYEGELIVINTAAGVELSVTPNHPVLTARGWVAAGELVEGDNLIRYHGDVEQPLTSRPNHEGVESCISEVFESLRQSRHVSAISVPGSAEHFHGDGSTDSEVDIVLADRLLGSDGEATELKLPPESDLLLSRVREGELLSEGSLLEVGAGAGHTAHGIVGGADDAGPLFCTRVRHARVHGGGAVTDGNPSAFEASLERAAGDTVFVGEFLDALTGLISTDSIVNVNRNAWAGHVYNLQTGGGWYTANSIIVHNCRCQLIAYLPGLSVPDDSTTYDPKAEEERAEQRRIEREIRAAKRDASTAGDDVTRAASLREIKELQAEMREHLKTTGRLRNSAREQLHFADGK